MTIGDTISLGPLNFPVRYLLFAFAAGFGYGVMRLVFRKHRTLREAAAGRLTNSFVIFVAVWKLEPLIAAMAGGLRQGNLHWATVWLYLLLPGGAPGAIAGTAAVFAYLGLAVVADVSRRREGASSLSRPRVALASSTALLSALLPAALVYLLVSVLLQPPALSSLHGATWSRPPAASAGGEVAAAAPIGIEVGDRAPGFRAETLSGGRLGLAIGAGQTIVLNFWATWCPPCRAELPDLVSFAARSRNQHIAVWAVNMTSAESSVAAVRRFSQENRIDFPILLDTKGRIAATYRVASIPTTFVISPRGIILAKQVGAMSPDWLRSRTSQVARR